MIKFDDDSLASRMISSDRRESDGGMRRLVDGGASGMWRNQFSWKCSMVCPKNRSGLKNVECSGASDQPEVRPENQKVERGPFAPLVTDRGLPIVRGLQQDIRYLISTG